MGTAIAMRSLIDHERAWANVNLVGTEIEQNVEGAGLGHRGRVDAPLARHEAEIERADARRGGVQRSKNRSSRP